MTDELPCDYCHFEPGQYELDDGRVIGKACVKSALREAETPPPTEDWGHASPKESFWERWRHIHLGRSDA